jgi:hypothetical protein
MRAVVTFIAWLIMSCAAFACTAISAPTTITAPGLYCLTSNVFVTAPNQHGVSIQASDVILDMQGKAIVGPGYGEGVGVRAIDVNRVTVRGGNIWGFHFGVHIERSNDSSVERMDVSGNILRGAIVIGARAIVEHTRVKGILGSSAFPTSHSMGIEVSGNNCNVRFNNVENIMPYGATEGVGISVSDFASGCQVYDNLVRFSAKPPAGRTFGVWVGGGVAPLSVHKNTILNADYGLFGYLATTTTTGNHSHQRCPTFWTVPSDFHTKNSIEYQGGCTDPQAGF